MQELGRLQYLGDDERQLARIVCRESDRLDAIIGEFLQFARLKPPDLVEADLGALLREVALLLGQGVRIDLPLMMAGTKEEVVVVGSAPIVDSSHTAVSSLP